jgi:hypothetical protein
MDKVQSPQYTIRNRMESIMNTWLLMSGIAALLLDLVHIFPGGKEIHRPMVASKLPEPVKVIWSAVWHAVTAFLAIGGAALIAAAFLPDHALALSVVPITLFLAFAGLFITYGLSRLGSLLVLPHWAAFLGISVLGLVGLLG